MAIAIGKLVLGFPLQPQESPLDVAAVYIEVVSDQDAGDVARACWNFLSDKVERKSVTFRPSAAEVCAEIKRIGAERWRARKAKAEAELEKSGDFDHIEDSAHRDSRIRRWEELQKELAANMSMEVKA